MKHFALPAFIASLLCLLLVLLPAANAAPENAMKAGLPHASVPARIIAAGGVITEIIYALGRSDLIVGVDSTSRFPEAALKEKPNVGYVRALSSEGLLSLKPTAVIAIDFSGAAGHIEGRRRCGRAGFAHCRRCDSGWHREKDQRGCSARR